MQLPPTPENEKDRIQSLYALNILDTPIQESFEKIIRITQALFNVPIVAFTLVDEERQWFKSARGLNVCETSREVSFCAHAICQDEIFIVRDTLEDERFKDNPAVVGDPYIRFYAGYPIHSIDNQKIGTLCIADAKCRIFTKDKLALLKDMATLVEMEMNSNKLSQVQKELIEELEHTKKSSCIDGLTRLWNRTGIEKILQNQINRCLREQKNFGVTLVDIDNFKKINDHYGHLAGDEVLREVAKILLSNYRETDGVGRWGGEEFLVVQDVSDAGCLFNIAERARNSISRKIISFQNQKIQVTITTGLSYFNSSSPCSLQKLIQHADLALYEGKRNGKNVVIENVQNQHSEIILE